MFWRKVPYHLPKSTGPYVPGWTDVMVGYTKNGFLVRFHYPTNAKNDDQENSKRWKYWYYNDDYIRGFAAVLMIYTIFLKTYSWLMGFIRIPALYGEKVRTNDRMDCILFSHGLGACRFFYSQICCELASRGFLVVSIEHRDNSACNTYFYKSKEDVVKNEPTHVPFKHYPLNKEHFSKRKSQVDQRAQECSQVLDFIKNLNKGIVPDNILDDLPENSGLAFNLNDFIDRINLDTLSIMGHSFGGGTALLTLSQRAELKQGILLDPWMFPIKSYNLHEKIEQPLLFINTQTFHIKTNVTAMEKYLNSEHYREMFTLMGTTHEHQTDSVLMFGSWLNLFMRKLSPELALNINNSMIFLFLNKYLNRPAVENAHAILSEHQSKFESGLTKAWA